MPALDLATLGLKLESGQLEAGARRADRALGRVTKSGKATQQMTQTLKRAMISLAAVMSVRKLIEYADSMKLIQSRIGLVTDSTEEFGAVQQELFKITQQTRTAFAATADVYTRLARNADQLGASQRDLLTVVKAINQALVVSGASAASASAALVQLGQAFASGVLRGEELNSVLEQAPRLAEAIAAGMGVTVGKLRALGQAGQLESKRVFDAILSQAAAIESEFTSMSQTVSQALTILRNAMALFIGQQDQSTGATAKLGDAVVALARNLGRVVAVVVAATSAWVTYRIAIASVAIWHGIITAVGTIRAFISLALTIRRMADAMALLSMVGKGAAGAIAAIAALAVGLTAYLLILKTINRETEKFIADLNRVPSVPGGAAGGIGADVLFGNAESIRMAEQQLELTREQFRLLQNEKNQRISINEQLEIMEIRQRAINAHLRAREELTGAELNATLDAIAAVRELEEAAARVGAEIEAWEKATDKAAGAFDRALTRMQTLLQAWQQFKGIVASGDPLGGALTGAVAGSAFGPVGAGIGAAAGLLGGFIGSIFNAGKAAREAARQVRQFEESLRQLVLQTFGTDLEQAIDAVRRQMDELRKAAAVLVPEGVRFTVDAPQEYRDTLAEITVLEARRIEQLREQARLREGEFRDDLRVRALRARGSSMEADALRFRLEQLREVEQAQRDNVDSATMVLLVQTLWAEKMARITALMLRRAEMLEDLEVRGLRARGFDDEADALAFALAQQREYAQAVRDGVDATTRAILAEVQRVEMIRFAAEMELRAADERVRAAQETVDATRRTVESLRDYSRSLGLTLATPGQSVVSARQEFQRVALLAQAGDQAAAAKLPELGRILLQASRAFNASGMGFVQDLRFVQGIIDQLADQFDAQATIEQQALDSALERQAIAQAILDALSGNEEKRRKDRDDDWRRKQDDDDRKRRDEEEKERRLKDRHADRTARDDERSNREIEALAVLEAVGRQGNARLERLEDAVESLSREVEGVKIA